MAEDFYVLSAEKEKLINEVIDRVKGLIAPGSWKVPVEQDGQTPEMYVAKVPSDGIPPLATSGTGTTIVPGTADTAGSAACDIYRIDDNGDFKYAGFSKTVFNITQDYIPPAWLPINRDKFGRWIAVPLPRMIIGRARSLGYASQTVLFDVMNPVSNKGVEGSTGDTIQGYVRDGFVLTNHSYALYPCVPVPNGTVYEVLAPTQSGFGINGAAHIYQLGTGSATINGDTISLYAPYGDINHGANVWVMWDTVWNRFNGIQVSCPTGTGT